MQCDNAGCDYTDVNVSQTLTGRALESLIIFTQIALNKRSNEVDFYSLLEFFRKLEIPFKCHYVIRKNIARPLFQHELIFRYDKKIIDLLHDMQEPGQGFLAFLNWNIIGHCPKCAYKKFRFFLRNGLEVKGFPINEDRVSDFDLSGKEYKKCNVKYWREEIAKMNHTLNLASSRRKK